MAITSSELVARRCQACAPGTAALSSARLAELLKAVPGWALNASGEVSRTFAFKDYYSTMAFVNAVAWIAHSEDHHPDMEVGYNRCTIRYSTHSVGGLSENDFVCAAKVSELTKG